jgi:hypothetical protein
MKWFLRFLYVLLVGFYFYALIDHFAYLKFTPWLLFKWFFVSSLWNCGVLLISFDCIKKRKILGLLFFIPTLITSPLLLPLKYDIFHWGCLGGMLIILIKYLTGEIMKIWPPALKEEAKKEAYKLIDKYLRKLPINSDGSINELASGLDDNDVDALRHAYVSGVFTQEYGEIASDIFGRANEYFPFGGTSSSNSTNSTNMDLWNNAVGRKYGKKFKTRKELFKKLMQALKDGELIIDPESDTRKYSGAGEIKEVTAGMIVVLDESKKGKNRIFYDFLLKKVMNKQEFVTAIKNGDYPNFELRIIHGDEIPTSKKDGVTIDNLG